VWLEIQKEKMKMATDQKIMPLKTPGEISQANEWLFNMQKDGKIDPKTADSLNTTIKNSVYLNVKMKMDYLKIFLQAQIKKIDLPKGLLPE
jgi:hypothetical protein